MTERRETERVTDERREEEVDERGSRLPTPCTHAQLVEEVTEDSKWSIHMYFLQ